MKIPPPEPTAPWESWLVSHRFGLALGVPPKCASTTLVKWWWDLHDLALTEKATWATTSAVMGMHLLDPPERQAVVDNYKTYLVVRDPWTRVTSCYISKIVIHQDLDNARALIERVQLHKGRAVNFEEGITFREFVEDIERTPVDKMDCHWAPCWVYHQFQPTRIIWMDRLWELQEEVTAQFSRETTLTRENCVPYGSRMNIGVMDRMPRELRQNCLYPDWRDFCDDALIDRIAHVYAKDIKMFNFERPE